MKHCNEEPVALKLVRINSSGLTENSDSKGIKGKVPVLS